MTSLLELLDGSPSGAPALLVPGRLSLSYGELRAAVEESAEGLRRLGVGAGDRVGMVYPNGAEAIVFFLAATELGTACPLNPAYKEDEFRFYLEDVGARALLVPPGEAVAARAALPKGALLVEGVIDPPGRVRLESVGESRAPGEPARHDPDAVALVLHTSGTTSRPKRVPLRHRNLLASVANIVAAYRLGPEDRSLAVMPLFHVHGLLASALATLASGGTVVVPGRFNPLAFWPLMRSERITWYSASPTLHQLVLGRARDERPDGIEGLRFVRSCSAALPLATLAEMESRYQVPVVEAYGMTEASHQMSSNPLPPGERRPGTVGPGTGVEVGTVDDEWRRLPAGEPGEVVVRGPNVIDGYERNPEADAVSFRDGWFRTGDRGVLDADGYMTLIGRIKELIVRGGEKIAPREVDEVLEAHPAVREAVAFGVPNATWGEEVAAAVVLDGEATEKEIVAHCRRHLAEFKVPKVLYFVDAIPRTPTGKVQRRAVASELARA